MALWGRNILTSEGSNGKGRKEGWQEDSDVGEPVDWDVRSGTLGGLYSAEMINSPLADPSAILFISVPVFLFVGGGKVGGRSNW